MSPYGSQRGFGVELGQQVPSGERTVLGELKPPSGKRMTAWAVRGDSEVAEVKSNLFEMEWPPKSGRTQSFPEVDRAMWCTTDQARQKLTTGQVPFIDRLTEQLRDLDTPFSESEGASDE